MRKGILASLLLVFGLLFTTVPANAASPEVDSTTSSLLTKEEIASKLLEIDGKYDVGQELNEEDANFIKKYGMKPAEPTSVIVKKDAHTLAKETLAAAASGTGSNFSGTNSNSSGSVKASTIGTYTLNPGFINQSYQITMTTAMSKGTATKITNSYTHTAYGAVGSGGIGKVYSNSDSSSTSSKPSCYSDFKDSYTAVVVYYTTVVKAVITYSGGSFTISVGEV